MIQKFPRLSAYARYIDEIWGLDLAFMDKLSGYNKGIKYLCVCKTYFHELSECSQ